MGSFLTGATGTGNSFQAAPITQQNFLPGIKNSANQFNQVFQNQGNLANMLFGQAQGFGPNPAQIMLNQATNRNIAQNAGFLSSQKGLSPALAARLAAQNAATAGQEAAGQGALMGAQQQLNAQNALSGLYGQQQQGALGMQSTLQNAQANQNSAINGQSQINAGVASGNQGMAGKLVGGIAGGIGSALGLAEGGKVPGKAPVKGDSPKNDIVDAKLSPGEIVIPRHITMHPNAPELAAKFVELELARHQATSKKNFDDGGQVPSALSVNQPPAQDIAAVPTAVAPQMPTAAQQSLGITNGMAEAFPDEFQGQAEAVQNEFNNAQERAKSGLAFQRLSTPGGGVPDKPLSNEEPDSGPAIMPQKSESATSGGSGGGGGIDSYLKSREDIAKEQTEADRQANLDYSQKSFDLDTERQNLMDAYKNGKIDPDRYFNNLGTGGKIRTALGIVLGGLGSGLTGQPNAALEMLNKHIDNDIKAQEADMSKNKNLLSANMDQTRDLRSAREATRIMQRDLMADKLQEAENNSKDPIVRARAQALRNGLMLQNMQASAQLKMWQQMQSGQGMSQDPAGKIRQLSMMGYMPKDDKAAADKELGSAQRIEKLRGDVENAANLLDSKFLAGKLTPSSRASAVNTFAGILAKEAEGRFNLDEAKNQMAALLPEAGDLPSTRREKALHRKQFFDSFANHPVLDQYGISVGGNAKPMAIKSFKPTGTK